MLGHKVEKASFGFAVAQRLQGFDVRRFDQENWTSADYNHGGVIEAKISKDSQQTVPFECDVVLSLNTSHF